MPPIDYCVACQDYTDHTYGTCEQCWKKIYQFWGFKDELDMNAFAPTSMYITARSPSPVKRYASIDHILYEAGYRGEEMR